MERQSYPIEDEVSSENSVPTEEAQKIALHVDRGGPFRRTLITVELPPTAGLPLTTPCEFCDGVDMQLGQHTYRNFFARFNTVLIFPGIALYTCPSCLSEEAPPNQGEYIDRQWLFMVRIKQRLLNYLWDAERNGKHVDMDEIAELPISLPED